MRTTMYQDKGILGLIFGSLLTLLGSIIMSITRSDITFAMTIIVGITTTTAACIKMRRDWKEGGLKPFWRLSRRNKKRA
jgi:hypothetical protein